MGINKTMKQLIKVGFVLASVMTLAGAAVAGPVTGSWRGIVRYDASKLPSDSAPNHAKLKAQVARNAANVHLSLAMKPDHTFLLQSGSPSGNQTVVGTWAQSGNAIQMTFKKGAKSETDVYSVSKDGKSISITKGPASLVFFR
jgi:hypothetical protein